MGGKGGMIKTSISLQDLRRRIYTQAKAEKSGRFWGLYVHVCKLETLQAAYEMAKCNDGAPGIDGVTFAAIEAAGVEEFLQELRDELISEAYRPLRNRRKEIPKGGGQVRILFLRYGIGGFRARSSVSWSLSLRPTCKRGRTDTDRSERPTKRYRGWLRPSSTTRLR